MRFKKMMNERERQEKLRKRNRELLIEELRLSFNEDSYAPATPAFWDAWRAKTVGVMEFAPAKYPAEALGLPGEKPVWVVFTNRNARDVFEGNLKRKDPKLVEDPRETKGLGWQALRANGGMFLDDRRKTYRSQRAPVVAWLNYNRGCYSVNVVHSDFNLKRPIPNAITDLGAAVEWVYQNSDWQ